MMILDGEEITTSYKIICTTQVHLFLSTLTMLMLPPTLFEIGSLAQ
jgi:hypothetical protein